ncbi:MAG: RNA polymerase sigma factor [Myxococcota bacterium]|nr:RNA polymerase sigma factor [Myxococcota bacterium]
MQHPPIPHAGVRAKPGSRPASAAPTAGKPAPSENRWAEDRELAKRILAGNREDFDALYESYFPRVYRFALKRLRDPGEAEDVTQEVFITVFKVLGSYEGNSSLLVWIFGITRNKVNRRFRKVRPPITSIDEPDAMDVATTDAPTDRAVEARRLLEQCEQLVAQELTPLQRRIFHLKHLRRQSIRSIAEALGKSEDAIKANLYRMRRTISEAAPGLESLLQA